MRKIKALQGKAAENLFRLAGKYKFVLLMVAVGVLLMMLPSVGGEKGQEAVSPTTAAGAQGYSLERTQEEMERIVSSIDGVGRAEIMLTVSSGGRIVYQDDQEISYTGSAGVPEDYTSRTQTVLTGSGSGETALPTQELYPEYIGAVVVCDGGGRAGTVLKVKEAVSVLTGLSTDRISVVKRSES
ncbi:MAG TPA: hypothetical protein H9682_05070 [Firmicutes bacterium]|nr:hypothetical protein [Bacillota bacterium]